jgi:REP element-mobilizing transposase RayT
VPGGIHHVTARGVRRLPIYTCDADYRLFLDILGLVAAKLGWKVLAYCLIPNHYHLVIQTPEPNLSEGMHRLNGRYARAFNERYGHTGHVFEARFGAEPAVRDAHLLELVRYVHRNPVRARLCLDPGEWTWSSYRALAGTAPTPPWLAVPDVLALFGRARPRARERLRAFVADAPRAAALAPSARPP